MARLFLASLLAIVGLVACQPLYGSAPDKLKNPEKKHKPADTIDPATEIKYVDECTTNFRDNPKLVRADTTASNALVGAGDDAMVQANKAKEPSSQSDLIKISIEKYRNALMKDPYNADATLKLAVAYDRVFRKGCALKLLARLVLLEGHPKYQKDAKNAADRAADNAGKEWFKGYKKDAITAVGR